MNVEQLIDLLQTCEPTARVVMVEGSGFLEVTGAVQPADRDVVLLCNVFEGLMMDVE